MAKLSDPQKRLLHAIETWPGRFPMHVTDLHVRESRTVASLKRLGLISGKGSLRLSEKGREILTKLRLVERSPRGGAATKAKPEELTR